MKQQVASLSNQQYGEYTTLLNYVSVVFGYQHCTSRGYLAW